MKIALKPMRNSFCKEQVCYMQLVGPPLFSVQIFPDQNKKVFQG